MTVVIDIGCAKWGSDESIPYLVEEFKPEILYGFDPAAEDDTYAVGETSVRISSQAAWTHAGTIGFRIAGLGGHVDEVNGRHRSRCFDLADFIADLRGQEIVLKMDAEGAEYVLLPYLAERGVDVLLKLAIIEWHCEHCGLGGNGRHRENCKADRDWWQQRRESVESQMRCEMAEWNL